MNIDIPKSQAFMKHDLNQLAKAIHTVRPDMGDCNLEHLLDGWHSSAFILNNNFIIRVANTQHASSFYKAEERYLPIIGASVSCTIPRPVAYESLGFIFAIHSLIPGKMYVEVCESDTLPSPRILQEMALFLTELHRIDNKSALDGIAYTSFVDTIRDDDIHKAAHYLGDGNRIIAQYERFLSLATTLEAHDKVLTHGDFNHANIIIDPVQSCLSGVIDFSELSYRIPEHDFMPLMKSDPLHTHKIAALYTEISRRPINMEYVGLCAYMRAYKGVATTMELTDTGQLDHYKSRLTTLNGFTL